jgi:hypothetical protein
LVEAQERIDVPNERYRTVALAKGAAFKETLQLEQLTCSLLAVVFVTGHMAVRIDGTIFAAKLENLVRSSISAKGQTYCTAFVQNPHWTILKVDFTTFTIVA